MRLEHGGRGGWRAECVLALLQESAWRGAWSRSRWYMVVRGDTGWRYPGCCLLRVTCMRLVAEGYRHVFLAPCEVSVVWRWPWRDLGPEVAME